MTTIAIRNIKVAQEEPIWGWVWVDKHALDHTDKASKFDYHGTTIWLPKKCLTIWNGAYYAEAKIMKEKGLI